MSDIQTLQKDYEAAETKLKKIAAELAAAHADKLKSLPALVELKSVDALIKALIPLASGVLKGKLKGALDGKVTTATAKPAKTTGRKARAKLDDETRAKIVAALKTGKKTAAEVAKEFDVSVATVNDIKAKAKLTKKRK